MAAKHKFDLIKKGIKRDCMGGNRRLINGDIFASMGSMALATILLKRGGVREPHWHPNADELTYCAEGKALVTMFSPGNNHDTFTLSQGEVMHIPKGAIHHIENIDQGESKFILAYDHGHPEDLDLSESVGSMTPHNLAATFGVQTRSFEKIQKEAKDVFIARQKTVTRPPLASIPNRNKFDLERINPQIETKGGSARILNQLNFPPLQRLALFSLRIAVNGVREPHWHPNSIELNFVLTGSARLTILSPGGDKDTFDLQPGQGSIIPAGYFHHIENTGDTELHMTVFFSNAIPNDIGLSGALSAYSKELLGTLFSVDPQFFADLHKFQEDRMIVMGGG